MFVGCCLRLPLLVLPSTCMHPTPRFMSVVCLQYSRVALVQCLCVTFPQGLAFGGKVWDLELAKLLLRPGSQFMEDPMMKDETLLTDGNYGSVKRVFVIAKADGSSTEDAQRRMVDLSPGAEVEEIAGADHMAMLSKPTELCEVLLKIANKYD
ncbi:hypothetical protein SETIT_5G443100v2 [Setaria italica]|uniref:AB hydrolase-1 domain-containing protein n=1 Tax=Setaria italica TaxID=4555 RepID=A0A368RFL5_SETIT|nr:hypothetical protein SETIT_5G443100v2 [Setaria italica]